MHKLLFSIVTVFIISSCKENNSRTEVGELKLVNTHKYNNGQLDSFTGVFNRNLDTPVISLYQELVYISQKSKPSLFNDAIARSPNYIPNYSPDSIDVFTLTPFNNTIGANSNITHLMGYLNRYNYSPLIYRLNQYRTNRSYDYYYNNVFYLLLMEDPTKDSIKLKINYYYNGDIGTRTVETKWLRFN